jgi:hypothetical protein
MFDAYRMWLGIRPEYQPPTHYRLLGVSLGESDPKKIDVAAKRRIAHLRKFQSGLHANIATKLMNEVARARAVLLDPKKRQEYDASLGLAALSNDEPPLDYDGLGGADLRVLAVTPRVSRESTLPEPRRAFRDPTGPDPTSTSPQIPWPVWIVGAGALVLLGMVLTLMLNRPAATPTKTVYKDLSQEPLPSMWEGKEKDKGAGPGGGAAIPPPALIPPPNPKPPITEVVVREKCGMNGHAAAVTCVALSIDGMTALSGSLDHTIRRWDVRTAAEQNNWPTVNKMNVRGLGVGAMDSCVVCCGEGGDGLAACKFAGRGLVPLRFRNAPSNLQCLAMKRDGLTVVTGSSDGVLQVWDVNSGAALMTRSADREPIWAVAASGDGRVALSAGGGKRDSDGKEKGKEYPVHLWTPASGKPTRSFLGHEGPVMGLAISPDGSKAVSASHDGTVRVWEVATGKQVQVFAGHEDWVECVAFCPPDGRRVISGGRDRMLRMWDVHTGREVARFEGHTDRVSCLAIKPDGKLLLSGSYDKTVRVWEIPISPFM